MNEKQNIGALFDRIALKYDFLNHLLSLNVDRWWRKKAVKSLINKNLQSDVECLDVAIGTADLAIELARQLDMQHKTFIITGVDLSVEMMHIGQEKVRKCGLQNQISFMNESALEMPFKDNSFDVVTCAYGVRNFSDLNLGLKEMHRVLKPGGQLMILEFSYPKNKLIAWFYDLYFTHILPTIGRLFSKDKTAYSYLNRSVKNFVWGKEMCNILKTIGFSQVTYKPLTFGITTIYNATKDVVKV
ncbi:MAG: bifunctional demethylmenaquinone methyltransferase/2-methoxy-6-polyprenyl-1,4-benzoquinol methylase UbiE [Bacteroidaceae bacterium]|nr:bifunctional demethylmenaquinone methyltransferase/2-methoxy-6-polyprenyl-1,4-benzoquinol methylase UbiE [Bacteroidaceae bacterium]